MIGRSRCITLTFALFLGVSASTSWSAPILVTDRATLAGNDFFDWSAAGPISVEISNPFSIASNSGLLTATVQSATTFLVLFQPAFWNGNFAPGDYVLFTQFAPADHIEIWFSSPVSGVGTQVQAFFFGDFTATLEVFDASNVLTGTFSLPGISDSAGDGSAIFLGAFDPAGIGHVEYSVLSPTGRNEFAINRLDVVSTVPEPTTLLLLSAGLASAGVRYRRRKK